jgi:hypothetical protein
MAVGLMPVAGNLRLRLVDGPTAGSGALGGCWPGQRLAAGGRRRPARPACRRASRPAGQPASQPASQASLPARQPANSGLTLGDLPRGLNRQSKPPFDFWVLGSGLGIGRSRNWLAALRSGRRQEDVRGQRPVWNCPAQLGRP